MHRSETFRNLKLGHSSTRETRQYFTATPCSSTRRHNYLMPRSTTRRQTTTRPTLLRVVAFLYAPPPTCVRRSSTHVNYAPRSSTRRRLTSRLTLDTTFVAVQHRARPAGKLFMKSYNIHQELIIYIPQFITRKLFKKRRDLSNEP